jgi:toxin ParE1/3/4
MRRARISNDARSDLKEIYRYIAQDNRSAALRVIDRLRETFDLLAAQPQMGEARDDLEPNFRMFTVGNYVILFRPYLDCVEIVQVVHAARDLNVVLRRPKT